MQTLYFKTPYFNEIKHGKLSSTIRNRNGFNIGEKIEIKNARSKLEAIVKAINIITNDDLTESLANSLGFRSTTALINNLSQYRWHKIDKLYLIEFEIINNE